MWKNSLSEQISFIYSLLACLLAGCMTIVLVSLEPFDTHSHASIYELQWNSNLWIWFFITISMRNDSLFSVGFGAAFNTKANSMPENHKKLQLSFARYVWLCTRQHRHIAIMFDRKTYLCGTVRHMQVEKKKIDQPNADIEYCIQYCVGAFLLLKEEHKKNNSNQHKRQWKHT